MNYYIYINEKSISNNLTSAMQEYIKRLSAYSNVYLNTSPKLELNRDIDKEGHHVLVIDKGISTDSSESFAEYINGLQLSGISNLHVIIGYGELAAYDRISISAVSLCTETTALIFLEQLYRAYTIIHGKTYHK